MAVEVVFGAGGFGPIMYWLPEGTWREALGWRDGGRYLPLQDDIASVAFWYQTEPHIPFRKLPSKDALEVN